MLKIAVVLVFILISLNIRPQPFGVKNYHEIKVMIFLNFKKKNYFNFLWIYKKRKRSEKRWISERRKIERGFREIY